MCLTISCEKKTKRLYFYISGFVVTFTAILIMRKNDFFKESFDYFLYINSFSRILVIIPHFIIKCYSKGQYNDKPPVKNSRKDYIIFILNILINFLFIIFSKAFVGFFFSVQGLLLLFASFQMKYFYDFKFYSHKILGLVLFFALSIIIDALLYITKVKTIFIPTSLIIQICYVYLYSITLTYRKYLMEEKYMSAFKVCSIYGLIDLFAQIILDIIYYNYGSFLYHNKKVVTFSILPSIKTNNNFSNSFLKSIPYIICYVLFYCFDIF
jgi:hypothetical protein